MDRLLIAYSGGPDSTALLRGALELRRRWPGLEVHAFHLDHGLDPESGARAHRARELAASLGASITVERGEVVALRARGESLEAAARRVRYDRLEQHRRALGAACIATAHHADDQAETVLLRLLSGTGLAGLAAIRPVQLRVVRPLLELTRRDLRAELGEGAFIEDPTNLDRRFLRNRVRLELLPALENELPGLVPLLARIAKAMQGAAPRIESVVERALGPVIEEAHALVVRRSSLETLPDSLRTWAVTLLCRRLGAEHPPSRAALNELSRQLRSGQRVAGALNRDLEWAADRRHLRFRRRRPPTPPFSYTFRVPGQIEIAEVGARFQLHRAPVEAWMLRAHPQRVGLELPLNEGDVVEVRNRRAGDRVRPFGHRRPRRLKELLIDHGCERESRDRIPLLVVGGDIAWVPGVTVAENCRLTPEGMAWIAEIVSLDEENRRR